MRASIEVGACEQSNTMLLNVDCDVCVRVRDTNWDVSSSTVLSCCV